MDYLHPIPNKVYLPRHLFLKRALKSNRYYTGEEGLPCTFRIWAKFGKPDFIIIRNDSWELTFRENILPIVYDHFISYQEFSMVIISCDGRSPKRNNYEYNDLQVSLGDLLDQP